MPSSLLICIIASVASSIGVIIWLVWRHEKKRSEALGAVAPELGMTFSAAQDDALLAKMQGFSLFGKGHSRKMKNVMQAETEIADIAIFEYAYTTGGGKSSHRHQFSIVSMASDTLALPRFSLRPEHFLDKIGSVIGLQDIDFDDHPEFSKMFVLKGDDEAAIRGFFDSEMLDMFASRKGLFLESAPGQFIYFQSVRKKPDQIREFMEEGIAVYSAFLERQSRQ